MTQLPRETKKDGDTQTIETNQRNTNEYTKYKPRLNSQKKHSGLYELVLVAVHMENFQCTAWMPGTTSTALPSFSHDQHHKTDVAKRKGGAQVLTTKPKQWTCIKL